ncbi:Hsp20/alpha crystallin family protein [Candidatus Bathycorpusculum sp.]|jgi:HSP20 family molecular chaperone IbpA|uniref:Hsp20/alpha crystallin family protein n=1 Tax=Candidatus Bathycorpusculum sp. TaxID=2994959 RepID=UPI00282CA01F|nr:Hsp20/alpha crystallin family protein [Candidatus Termitimicrobium sp.]MCL2685566.1 Hsp20/alpha crystallin family protein [Candidatus Termitimicrobium sp.]
MSAKWRRSNKNRKWLDIDELAAPKKLKGSAHKCKSLPMPPNFRTSVSYAKRKCQEPKPLIDIFQDSSTITVVAEIVGFSTDSVKVSVKDQRITLSAKSKERRYYKSLNLPKVVIPDETHTKFKNGVLEIKLKKAESTAIGKEADQHAP